ncbi:hypothetical protein [Nitrosomonas mobilis]|uniref:Uncharacterized protein n=1 Tax=Nitrosomonas mobilis TaxID=51642 RepID=A0A1G5SHX4_9PROT|nr:hypothetical protein [Nitrosomonas mobilis]SCZ86813.1 hypothetical protein NSMM_800007 [Nitrosomonas mobilis]
MKFKDLLNVTLLNNRRAIYLIGMVVLLLTILMLSSCFPKKTSLPLSLEEQLEQLERIQSQYEDDILDIPGVLGIGIGRSENGLHFSVFIDKSEPAPALPKIIGGIPVWVLLRDPIQLLDGFPPCGAAGTAECHADRQPLPVEMGNSGGWNSSSAPIACSLGFKACDLGTQKIVFVTNSHCNQSITTCEMAPMGSTWVHPGLGDVNSGSCITDGLCDVIGKVSGHAPLSCNSNSNLADATKIESSSEQTFFIFRDIGFSGGEGSPMIGDPVRKSGRTTGDTRGTIVHMNVSRKYATGCCDDITMKGLIEWVTTDGTVMRGGDSGSALLSDRPAQGGGNVPFYNIVGLNFAVAESTDNNDGNTLHNYANHIKHVLAALNLSLDVSSCLQDCLFTSMANTLSDPEIAVSLGHKFREQVLEKSSRGQQYKNIYYQITDEAVRIAATNPKLLLRTAKVFQSQRPLFNAMLEGLSVEINHADLEVIDDLLKRYQKYGSPHLQIALDVLRKDLYDDKVLAEFNVKIEYY